MSQNLGLETFLFHTFEFIKKAKKYFHILQIFKGPSKEFQISLLWLPPSSSPHLPKKLKTYILGELWTFSSEIQISAFKVHICQSYEPRNIVKNDKAYI